MISSKSLVILKRPVVKFAAHSQEMQHFWWTSDWPGDFALSLWCNFCDTSA